MDPIDESRSLPLTSPDHAQRASLAAGQKVFERYVLSEMLGRGAGGLVWRAHDEVLARDVALKFLPASIASDPTALERLKVETRRALELTHPHIVRIHDLVQNDNLAAISMEWIDGQSLASLKRSAPGGCLDWTEIAPWIDGLCAALDHAHTKARIVHRDLKPSNILLSRSGLAKIADFGISSALGDSSSPPTENSGGTLLYMSPRHMRGEPPHPSDDIYALGATLYELLTGKPPFFTGDISAQLERVTPPSVEERRRQLDCSPKLPIPPGWEAAIASCLAKDPSHRPPSAAAFAAALEPPGDEDAATQATLIATAPAAYPVHPATAKRSRRPAAYAAIATLILGLVGAAYYFGVHRPGEIAKAEAAKNNQSELAEKERLSLEKAAAQSRADEAERRRLAEVEQKLKAQAAELDARIAAEEARVTAETEVSKKASPPANPLQAEIDRHPWTAIEAWLREAKRPLWEQPTLAATSEVIAASSSLQFMRADLLRQKENNDRQTAMRPQGIGPGSGSTGGLDQMAASQLQTYAKRLAALDTVARRAAERYRLDYGLKFRNGTAPDWPDLPAIIDDGFAAKILGKSADASPVAPR